MRKIMRILIAMWCGFLVIFGVIPEDCKEIVKRGKGDESGEAEN